MAPGVYFKEKTAGVLFNNNIFRNLRGNVIVDSMAKPLVKQNNIYGSKECGIWIKSGGSGAQFMGNEIHHNGQGITIDGEHDEEILQNNSIHDNGDENS